LHKPTPVLPEKAGLNMLASARCFWFVVSSILLFIEQTVETRLLLLPFLRESALEKD